VAAEIITGLGAIKTAFDLAKGLKDISDATVRNSAVIELQERILTAQATQAALVERVGELEKKITGFETWEFQKKRYQLKDFGGGTFAYELKPAEAQGEPIHRICPACFERGSRSILQYDFRTAAQQDRYVCSSCKTQFEFGIRQERQVNRSSRRATWGGV
jgi:hypothetical protein